MLLCFVFWSVAPPTACQPIRKSVVFQLPGCQLPLCCSYKCFRAHMPDISKPRYIPKSETQQGSGEEMPLNKMEAPESGEEVIIFTLDSANFG